MSPLVESICRLLHPAAVSSSRLVTPLAPIKTAIRSWGTRGSDWRIAKAGSLSFFNPFADWFTLLQPLQHERGPFQVRHTWLPPSQHQDHFC